MKSENMLQLYRSKASFDNVILREIIDSKDVIGFQNELYSKIENDPLFKRSSGSESLDTTRRNAQVRARRIVDYGFLNDPRIDTHPLYLATLMTVLNSYDSSTLIKATLGHNFFSATVRGLGSSEQQKYADDIANEKISGCFGLTEIAHGTDARHMRLKATYDPQAKQFVLHSDDFQAAKCWVGNLAQGATHGVVFAQLIMPDGQHHGLHTFVVPLRDPDTFLPYPGVIIGDLGEKIGVNGMDNGFCMFKQYRIPRENLLNKFGNVTEDGQYVSPIKDARKRFALALGTLVGARLGVLYACNGFLSNALTIAIRYSAVRKQFGPSDNEELSVLEYPLQQWRLLPHLAALFAMKATASVITIRHFDFQKSLYNPNKMLNKGEMDELAEFHALCSVFKALYSWTAQTAIQQCRESCGGHGYLMSAGLGRLRNDNDASCTYEGANIVLQQQASNWLVKLWRGRARGERCVSPLGSVAFMNESRANKMTARSELELCRPPVILEAYEWLICWLAEQTSQAHQKLMQQTKDAFFAQNHSQVYLGLGLSLAYGEHYLLKCLWEQSCAAGRRCQQSQAVLAKLCTLYGLYSLEKHLVYLHQGNYVDSRQSELVQSAVVSLCGQLKTDAVSLADVISPPDFMLNSVIGRSDGELYKNLENELMPSVNKRPTWWPELSGTLRSRL